MAHKVTFSMPERELGKADIEFLVRRNGSVIGRLLVSKGAVVWRKKWKSKRGRQLGWADFHGLMQKHGQRI